MLFSQLFASIKKVICETSTDNVNNIEQKYYPEAIETLRSVMYYLVVSMLHWYFAESVHIGL